GLRFGNGGEQLVAPEETDQEADQRGDGREGKEPKTETVGPRRMLELPGVAIDLEPLEAAAHHLETVEDDGAVSGPLDGGADRLGGGDVAAARGRGKDQDVPPLPERRRVVGIRCHGWHKELCPLPDRHDRTLLTGAPGFRPHTDGSTRGNGNAGPS